MGHLAKILDKQSEFFLVLDSRLESYPKKKRVMDSLGKREAKTGLSNLGSAVRFIGEML